MCGEMSATYITKSVTVCLICDCCFSFSLCTGLSWGIVCFGFGVADVSFAVHVKRARGLERTWRKCLRVVDFLLGGVPSTFQNHFVQTT